MRDDIAALNLLRTTVPQHETLDYRYVAETGDLPPEPAIPVLTIANFLL